MTYDELFAVSLIATIEKAKSGFDYSQFRSTTKAKRPIASL